MLAELLSSALAERSGHAALSYDGVTLTFRQLSAAAERLAGSLSVAPGERVAVVAPNAPALVVGLLASWRAGAVAVPLSARLRRFELGRVFADAEPAAAVSVARHGGFELGEEIAALAERTPSVRTRLVVDQLGEVVHHARLGPRAAATPSPGELAAILYTSGTTGEPKGALVSHQLADAMGRNLAAALGEYATAPYGLPVPISHAFGLGCLLAGLTSGATAILSDVTTSVEPLLGALRVHGAEVLHGSPSLLGRVHRAGAQLSVRTGYVAGSWCPPDLLRALDERGVRVLNLYGMTELGAIASCTRDDPPQTRFRTVGRALPGYELRVRGNEIEVRSPYLPAGYHGRPWSSDELSSDGWFRTGDLGELDAAGNLAIVGRAKEVVNVGGFNVFPAEVESFLLTNPAIAQAAVVGVAHPALGEALQAFVTAATGASLEPGEVVRFARGGIAGYKVPYEVRVLDELPLLPSGKPDRLRLAEMAEPAEVARR